MSKQTNATTPVLGWHEAAPVAHETPRLLATLRAPRKRGAIVAVYSDGSLGYQFAPNPKWIRSRISVYTGVHHGRLGSGETLTPEQFIERMMGERGYVRVEGEGC
jgi:hypothetical protein